MSNEETIETLKRTTCKPDEFPRWAIKFGGGAIFIEAGGRLFRSTRHLTVCVTYSDEATYEEGSKKLETLGWATIALPAAAVGRAYAIEDCDERDYKAGGIVCNVGVVRVNLKYVLLVERLFPGCTWAAAPSARVAPVQALVDGVVVALVAGQEAGVEGGMVGDAVPS